MKVVVRLVDRLIQDGAVEEEDREIYEYGFNQGIVMLINILCTILIGLCMGMLLEVLVFMATYIPLRTFGGGFHAKTQVRCFIYSNLLVVGILLLSRFIAHSSIAYLILGLLGTIVVMRMAPVEDKNKPLDEIECRVYGKKARCILGLDLLLAIALQLLGFHNLVSTVLVSVFALGVFLIMGYVKNVRIDKYGLES
ncbi:MAG: accessory gene regulator B family protein [Clostridium sp.]|nr:accessory gene regulator B family protein [Clostridium sp.]